MDKKIIQEMIKQIGYYLLSYFTHYLFPIIKDAFNETKEYFISTLWDAVKEELLLRLESTVEYAKYYFESYSYLEKEKIVIDSIFKNAEFPLPLRPFKPLIKNILRSKLHKLVKKQLDKISAKL